MAPGSSNSTTHRSSPVSCCGSSSHGRSSSPELNDQDNDCYIALNHTKVNNSDVVITRNCNFMENLNLNCDRNCDNNHQQEVLEEENLGDNNKLLVSQG